MTPDLFAVYVGPDQVMPLASILATIAGFFLIFWNKFIDLLRRVGLLKPPAVTPTPEDAPAEKQTPPQV
jgi:hypothetical protein